MFAIRLPNAKNSFLPQRNVQLSLLLAMILIPTASADETTTNREDVANHGWSANPELVEKQSKRRPQFNYEEDKVPEYSLPDPLVAQTPDGPSKITAPSTWSKSRRQEILQLFRDNVYGNRPKTSYTIEYQTIVEKDNLFGIGAKGSQVRATISSGGSQHDFEFTLVTPPSSEPAPVIVQINNRYFIPLEKAASENDPFWPVQKIVERGYATASFHTSHICPDRKDGYDEGVRRLLDDSTTPDDVKWKSLSAWGWGASRVLDYLSQQQSIDISRSAVIGHSRGGKTALWASAEDERFKIAYSNNSGCGGAALSRRAFGETVKQINTIFPHWFCDRFSQFNDDVNTLPVDQHELIALMAPRAVYVASADEDLWADPRGEYTALVKASPVFELLGHRSIQDENMPGLNEPRHVGKTGYHIRSGAHNLTEQDWGYFLDFCDTQF